MILSSYFSPYFLLNWQIKRNTLPKKCLQAVFQPKHLRGRLLRLSIQVFIESFEQAVLFSDFGKYGVSIQF